MPRFGCTVIPNRCQQSSSNFDALHNLPCTMETQASVIRVSFPTHMKNRRKTRICPWWVLGSPMPFRVQQGLVTLVPHRSKWHCACYAAIRWDSPPCDGMGTLCDAAQAQASGRFALASGPATPGPPKPLISLFTPRHEDSQPSLTFLTDSYFNPPPSAHWPRPHLPQQPDNHVWVNGGQPSWRPAGCGGRHIKKKRCWMTSMEVVGWPFHRNPGCHPVPLHSPAVPRVPQTAPPLCLPRRAVGGDRRRPALAPPAALRLRPLP